MKVGQKVVYIQKDCPEIGLIKNKIYTIFAVAECNCKDGLCIDVGITTDRPFVYCDICNSIISVDDRYFFDHSGFRELDELDSLIEEISNESVMINNKVSE